MQTSGALTFDPRASWAARFVAAHLHDYNRKATTLWALVAVLGGGTLVVACGEVVRHDAAVASQILGWIAIVAVAAWFPIQIPHSKHSIAAGDIIVFLLLALYGSGAAVLAAALECLIGAIRSSRRLTSRVASVCAAAFGMTLAGLVFEVTPPLLQQTMLPSAAAHLAALALAAGLYYAVSTTLLMRIVYLKRGARLTTAEWFGSTSWVATLYLVSAVVAGLLSLNAHQFGRSASMVGIFVIGLSLALLRAHFRRQIAEHDAQEARVAAAQLEAAQNQRRFHNAFTRASIGMAIVGADGNVVQSNEALHALLGYDASQMAGRAFLSLLHQGDAQLLERHVVDVRARSRETFSIELRAVARGQREIWLSLHCARFDDDRTRGEGLIFQLHDITSRRRAEGELHHIAYHDSLTDLANRNCFHERLRVVLERGETEPARPFAVMYLDLDRFKTVNDSLGHSAGDELLKEVARRLRECAGSGDLVARLGGDEFAVLVLDPASREEVVQLGERILDALQMPALVGGTDVRAMASIGIAFSDAGYGDPESVLRDADIAMYKAKADGKGRIALFDSGLHEGLADRLQLETDLRRAIRANELALAFQPLYDLEPYRLTGFEALARWVHPVRGPVSPGVFIPHAEEKGDIEGLTAWAIDEAVHRLATWRRTMGAEIVMHVNVSGRDLTRDRLVPHVRDVLARHRVPARLLTLEITETTLMEQRDKAIGVLGELRSLGVNLSIDDFGTGYSSLAYLSTLPFDCLKIDRSFVVGMHKSPQNTEIVRTVLSLGRALNKHVIAEGIETHDQLMRLRELGTPTGQGYLLGRPANADGAAALLREATKTTLAA